MSDEPNDISRGTMTGLIVFAIAIAIGVFAYFETRLPDTDPVSQCQVLFWEDQDCRTAVAYDRALGGSGWLDKDWRKKY